LHPAPNVRDDRDTPLLWVRDGEDLKVIWVFGKPEYFCKGGLDRKSVICPSGVRLSFTGIKSPELHSDLHSDLGLSIWRPSRPSTTGWVSLHSTHPARSAKFGDEYDQSAGMGELFAKSIGDVRLVSVTRITQRHGFTDFTPDSLRWSGGAGRQPAFLPLPVARAID
jgi:hypothetical protein